MTAKLITLHALLLYLPTQVIGQNEKSTFDNLIVGSSYTFIWDMDKSNTVSYYTYYESTWNVNIAVSLNKRLYMGIQSLFLFTQGSRVDKKKYAIYGLFTQYDLMPKRDTRFFIETSINQGDYCTCGVSGIDPYRKKDLYYWGFGAGFDRPLKSISDKLYLDLSFVNYIILNKYNVKYNYTQYIIGLNYRFNTIRPKRNKGSDKK
ncbi:MAG: hypothetical protein OEX22_10240 [Cyclobacteriaceae bacterium]|nr:hypothetical protein [Cyclobacteriaceae bacterium]